MRPELTERQQMILDFIVREIQQRGYPPTLREISKEFGISSTQGVRRHIDALEKKGYIERDTGARSISVSSDILDLRPNDDIVTIPLLGEVAAGQPIFAEQNVEDRISVSSDWAGGARGDRFFLKVKGFSMADSILPGDLVLVERTPVAHNGEIIVAMLEDEATVKRFYKNGAEVRLKSDNPDFSDIIPEGPLTILGKVKALMRRY